MKTIPEQKQTDALKSAEPGSHKKVFLTAEWKHLINLTYAVDPDVLKPHLPAGLDLDIWQGSAHVSLVAFDFLKTRVLGLSIPTYRNFPEVNLRFYVRWKNKPAVVFIREFVPKRAISLAANVLYNEPYKRIPMESSVTADTDAKTIQVKHQFDRQSLAVDATTKKYIPEPNTAEHHFKEHDLGFGVDHRGRTLCYRVEHPIWSVFPLKRVAMNVDFARLYGAKWSFLNQAAPAYSLLAEGSQIKVRFPFSV